VVDEAPQTLDWVPILVLPNEAIYRVDFIYIYMRIVNLWHTQTVASSPRHLFDCLQKILNNGRSVIAVSNEFNCGRGRFVDNWHIADLVRLNIAQRRRDQRYPNICSDKRQKCLCVCRILKKIKLPSFAEEATEH